MAVKSIFKFPLERALHQTLQMPKGTQILTGQMQLGQITLWGLCPDIRNAREPRSFQIFVTGQELPEHCEATNYIATVQDRQYVWHIFEVN